MSFVSADDTFVKHMHNMTSYLQSAGELRPTSQDSSVVAEALPCLFVDARIPHEILLKPCPNFREVLSPFVRL